MNNVESIYGLPVRDAEAHAKMENVLSRMNGVEAANKEMQKTIEDWIAPERAEVVPIAEGGTGATTASAARGALGAASKAEFDALTIGGRNLLLESDHVIEVNSETTGIIYTRYFLHPDFDVNELIGKTVAASMFFDASGDYEDTNSTVPSSEKNRFGFNLYVRWADNTGVKADLSQYFGTWNNIGVSRSRKSMTHTFTPPSGYNTLYDVHIVCGYSVRPINPNVVWRMSHPKLEIGTRATDWTPAPEEMAKAAHAHSVADISDFPTSLPASDVSAWAKQPEKPAYTAADVGALPVTGGTLSGALAFATPEAAAQTFNNLGASIQAGKLDNVNTSGVMVTFPSPFAGVPVVVACGGSEVTSVRVRDITATGFRVVSGTDNNDGVQWIAIYKG